VTEEGQLGAQQADTLGVHRSGGERAGAVLHVGQHLDGVTVLGGRRPRVPGERLGGHARGVDPGERLRLLGVDGHRALLAVEEHGHPGRDVVQPAHRDDAGQAELAGDDRRVAGRAPEPGSQADHPGRVQPRGVGRGEVVGEQHRRHVGARDTRLALTGQLRDDAVADVADVGDPLGHEPAQRHEHVHELLRGLHRGDGGGGAAVDPLLDRRQKAPVARQAGRGGQHLRADPGRRRGPLGQPPRDDLGRRDETLLLARTGVLRDLRLILVGQPHRTGRPDHRAEGHAGHDGRAGEHSGTGGLREGGGGGRHGGPHDAGTGARRWAGGDQGHESLLTCQ
jgi:hypothetical protein